MVKWNEMKLKDIFWLQTLGIELEIINVMSIL